MACNSLSRFLPLTVASLAALVAVHAANQNHSTEQTFAAELAHSNVAEIEMGKLAQEKGADSDVRDFGAKMVTDHTRLNNSLKEWARSNHVSLPTGLSTAAADQKRKLEGLTGKAFDSAYISDMVNDHRHDVDRVEKISRTSDDPQVKQLAQDVLPTLQEHLQLAEKAAGKLGVNTK